VLQEVKDLVVMFLSQGTFGEKSQLSQLQQYKAELEAIAPPNRQASLKGQQNLE
jgi:hypothetical protein